jgi:hypothetical protein
MKIKDIADKIVRNNTDESTDIKNMTLSKQDLEDKLNAIDVKYLEVLGTENKVFEMNGWIHGYIKDGEILFDIPSWNTLIFSLNAFKETCY